MTTELNENLEDVNRIILTNRKNNEACSGSFLEANLKRFVNTEYVKSLTVEDCLDRFKKAILFGCVVTRYERYGEVICRTIENIIRLYVNYEKFELKGLEYSPLNYWFNKRNMKEVDSSTENIVHINGENNSCYRIIIDKELTSDGYAIFQIGCFIVNFKLNDEDRHCVFVMKVVKRNNSKLFIPAIKNVTDEEYQLFVTKRDNLIRERKYLSNLEYEVYSDKILSLVS